MVVFGDRFNYIEIWNLLPGVCGPSREVVSHSSGVARQVSLYIYRRSFFSRLVLVKVILSL